MSKACKILLPHVTLALSSVSESHTPFEKLFRNPNHRFSLWDSYGMEDTLNQITTLSEAELPWAELPQILRQLSKCKWLIWVIQDMLAQKERQAEHGELVNW